MEALGPKYLGWRGGAGRDDWRAGQKHLATPETPLGSRAGTPKLCGSEPDCTEDSIRSQRKQGIKMIKHALPLLWVQRDGKEAVSGCSGWRL